MRSFPVSTPQGRGKSPYLAPGQLGRLNDGTVVQGNAQGQPVIVQGPSQPNTQAIPANAGGGLVQGRGLLFQYQTPNVPSIANGVTAQVTIQFDQNSSFNWLRTTVVADISGAVETDSSLVLPLVTLLMTDQGSGQAFSNQPIPLIAIAGTAQLPYVLPTPQLLQPNASYIFTFNNYSAATTYNNLRLQLHGYRIFNSGQG